MFPLMCDYYEASDWKAERDKIGLPQIKGFCASVNILLNTNYSGDNARDAFSYLQDR